MTTPSNGQLGLLGSHIVPEGESIPLAETLEDFQASQAFILSAGYQIAEVPQLGDALPDGKNLAPWDYIVTHTTSAVPKSGSGVGGYKITATYAKPKQPYDTGISAVSGTATAVGAATLSTGLTWTANQFVDYAISIVTATTGAGQWRPILSHTTGGVVTVASNWNPMPTGTVTYKIWALTEILRKPETGRRGRVLGRRVFLCPDTLAEAVATAIFPELTPMDTSGAWQYALLRQKTVERRWRVGLARIECVYDSYATWGEALAINKGVLECETWLKKADYDLSTTSISGQTLDVVFNDNGVPSRWHVIKGEGERDVVGANFIIHGVLDSTNMNAVAALVDTINSASFSNILSGAAAKTLWFNKLGFRQRHWGQGLYDVRIYLAYWSPGWDHATTAQKQKAIIQTTKVNKDDGTTDTLQKQRIMSWITAGVANVDIVPQNAVSYSLLNGYLS